MPEAHRSTGVAVLAISASRSPARQQMLLCRGYALEFATLSWNVVGIVVLAIAVLATRSVALAGSGWTR